MSEYPPDVELQAQVSDKVDHLYELYKVIDRLSLSASDRAALETAIIQYRDARINAYLDEVIRFCEDIQIGLSARDPFSRARRIAGIDR